MESFAAISNAVVSKKRRITPAGVVPQGEIATDWDGNIATLVETGTMEDLEIANSSTGQDNVHEGELAERTG